MNVIATIFKWGQAAVVTTFVVGYLGVLLAYNTFNIVPPDAIHEEIAPGLKKKCTYCLTGLGTNQQWNMFAPNVGTVSHSPVVVLQMKDGERIALHSVVEPELPGWEGPGLIPNNLEGDARKYRWKLHLMDGRIRKLESKATRTDFSYWKARTVYARWRAARWIEENPRRKDEIARIELWRARLRHPGYGHEFTCESCQVLHIYPHWDPLWPIPIDHGFPMYHYHP